ncbi:hypothetical protein FB451DRAFT_1165884 [Mycena latifolia]|nr:hypothetical protein FB451DRAFT_1165884 [Mycena latifolia]
MRDTLISQLQSSILPGALSLIPNDRLRYTLLAIAACFAFLYAIHLNRLSTQRDHLEDIIQTTEGTIRDAKLHCGRDLTNLLKKGMQLLRVKRSTSMIQSRMLETALTWKQYRLLSRDISDCAKIAKKIRSSDKSSSWKLDVSANIQTTSTRRKLFSPVVAPPTMSDANQQS